MKKNYFYEGIFKGYQNLLKNDNWEGIINLNIKLIDMIEEDFKNLKIMEFINQKELINKIQKELISDFKDFEYKDSSIEEYILYIDNRYKDYLLYNWNDILDEYNINNIDNRNWIDNINKRIFDSNLDINDILDELYGLIRGIGIFDNYIMEYNDKSNISINDIISNLLYDFEY